MKFILIFIILLFFQNCSFDNKSGIWKNASQISEERDILEDLETLTSIDQTFDRTIKIDKTFRFEVPTVINNTNWKDIFYNQQNNFDNFNYRNTNQILFKSKKITKFRLNDYLLFEEDNLITSDIRGNIIVFSISKNEIISKFNFYKKNFKNIKKVLNLVVENNIIYVSDNFGYLYAFDYKKNKILWAKNYKIPFRSNLKIIKKKLVGSNQNNILYYFDKLNGNIIKFIPTEETIVKNQFINNISSNEKYSFFLNTYGSLYGIENDSMRIKWFVNLNASTNLNPSNLFFGSQIINYKDKVVVSSNDFTYILNSNNGSIIFKKNFSSKVKPLIINNFLFLISKRNLLIALNLNNGKIIYSYNVNEKIADFLNTKKKQANFKNLMMVNGKILVFLNNSYFLQFDIKGDLEKIIKLPSKIKSQPIIIRGSLLYTDRKNKISIVD